MRRAKTLLSLLLLAAAVGPLLTTTAVSRRAAPPADVEAKVTFKARPWASVTVDGKLVGTTPRTVSLSPGQHTAVFKRGKLQVDRTFEVLPGTAQTVMVDMNGPSTQPKQGLVRAMFNARPWAKVILDGKPVGSTPLITHLAPGQHTVTFTRGDKSATRTIEVRAGEPVKVMVDLRQ